MYVLNGIRARLSGALGTDGRRPADLLLAAMVGVLGALLLAVASQAINSPIAAAVGVVGLSVACGMLLSPRFATIVLAFSIPFERIGRLTNDGDAVAISASRILGVIVFASLILSATLGRRKLHFSFPLFLFGGYTAIALLTNIWTAVPQDTLQDSFRIVGNLLFFFLLTNIVRDYKTAKLVVMVWMAASLAAAVYSLGDYYLAFGGTVSEREMGLTSARGATVVSDGAEYRSLGINVRRLFGTTAHPTLFGLNNAMVLPFLVWGVIISRGWLRLLWLIGLPAIGYCILLSNTRAVLLAALIGALIMLWRRLLPLNAQALVAVLFVGLAIVPFIPADVYRRTLDPEMYSTAKGDAIRIRLKLWAKSWELIENNWLLGIGVGDRTTLVRMVTDENTGYLSTLGLRASSHNEFIWVMVEVGIIGYLCFWGFVGWVTVAAFRAGAQFRANPADREKYLFMAASQTVMLVVILFSGQSEAFHYPLKGWWLMAAVSTTLLEAVRREARQNSLQPQINPMEPVEHRAG